MVSSYFTGTGKTNIWLQSGSAQVFLCILLHQQFVMKSTCMDSGHLHLIQTTEKIFHTITLIKKDQSLLQSGKSPINSLPNSSNSTECMGKVWLNWLCPTVPKDLTLEVPNDCVVFFKKKKVPKYEFSILQNRILRGKKKAFVKIFSWIQIIDALKSPFYHCFSRFSRVASAKVSVQKHLSYS